MAAGWLLPLLLLFLLPSAAAIEAQPDPDGSPLPALCWLPPAVGPCRAAVPRWWFNGSAGSCQSFVFGGCDGNANNFASERDCRESCARTAAPARSQHRSDPTFAELCTAPRLTGPCRAAFVRWFFDASNRTCRRFVYGGCRGNKNNFADEEECRRRCGATAADSPGAADFRGYFFSTKALAFGVLLAVLALIFLGYITDVTLKSFRRKTQFPATGMTWNPGDDKEYLMSNAYTL